MAPKRPLKEPLDRPEARRIDPPLREAAATHTPGWPERRAGLAIERSADAFLSIDERGTIIAWNPAAERLFGWSAQQAIGRSVSVTLVPERLRAEHERGLSAFLAGARGDFLGHPVELPARRRDGSELVVEASISALRTEAGWSFDAWARDVTARRRAELEADEARSQFFATVAHELATPATALLGQLEAIGEADRERLGADARQALETLESEAGRIARLVADLRIAAQTRSGDLSLAKEQIRLGELIAAVVEAERPRAEAKGVELLALIERDPFYRGDPDRLSQVVHNLVSNAIKFTPAGGRVLVKVICGAGELLVKVADTGPGLDASERATAFERDVGSGPEAGGGMRIGLAVARAIVEAHGGTIEVEDEAGGGATFAVHLPTGPEAPRRRTQGTVYESRRSLRAPVPETS